MTRLKKRTEQSIIAVVIVVIVAIITVFVFRTINHNNADDPATNDTTNNSQSSSTTDPAAETSTSDNNTSNRESEKEYSKYETPDANSSNTITGILSYVHLENNEATINFAIDQYLTTGTCSIDFNGVLSTIEIDTAVSTSNCTFHFSNPNFTENHPYPYTITITSGEKSGTFSGETSF